MWAAASEAEGLTRAKALGQDPAWTEGQRQGPWLEWRGEGEGRAPGSSGPWEGCEGGLGCEAYSQYRINHQRGMV